MTTWILSLIVIVLAVGGLSIGVLMGRKPIQGSCGGLSNLTGQQGCDLCGGSRDKCNELRQAD